MMKLFQSAPAVTVPADNPTEQTGDQTVTVQAPPERTGMDVMASGCLLMRAEERVDRDGRPYTRASLSVTRDGLPPLRVRLVSHVPKCSFSLHAMEPGEALSVSGNLLLTDTGSPMINVRRLLTATPNIRNNPNPNWRDAA